MANAASQTVEQLREMARNRGFRLARSQVRTPGRKDYGKFGLISASSGEQCFGFGKSGFTASANEIEEFLRGQSASRWRQSAVSKQAGGASGRRKPAPEASSSTAPPRRPKSTAPPRRPKAQQSKPDIKSAPARPPAKADKPVRPVADPAPAKPREVRIRAAKSADAAAIASLVRTLSSGAAPRTLKQLLAAQVRAGLPLQVADNGKVVGVASAVLIQAAHRARPIGRIVTVVVDKEFRRQGIGGNLVDAVEKLLRRKGCEEFEAAADVDFSGAGAFFRARGYGRSTYRFNKAS